MFIALGNHKGLEMASDTQQHPPATDGKLNNAGAESIDQVRDLLFGAHMRGFESQLQSLTERIAKEHTAMRADFDRANADLKHNLEQIAADVRSKKLDSTALAAMLNEMAKKLGELK